MHRARRLTACVQDALRLIHRFVRAREHLLICGGRCTPIDHNEGVIDESCILNCFWDVDLNNGQWLRLPNMPRTLNYHCCALRGTDELWVFGGAKNYGDDHASTCWLTADSSSGTDAFIYSFAEGGWSRIAGICGDMCERSMAACVIYKDAAYIFGGHSVGLRGERASARDVAFGELRF